ncbi:pyrroline-5-carboxylate reductase [Secundilactobacillus paracollinoides]|uniref:Pyrroline-5-carboxylate reductase n=1 Tax=Secundilactobacillus paracollinoides TaxID=240427 RepID=A0A1B2IUM7_9LACO|nr:pyrroline-5-carboxylate reductase [Secundilactobacillus paracollinoides]ANZ59962.1 pyrroline-5-carboxylate reductase [Secundilactobacillus paracollinoides]ANZ65754.1 pyrroline-5-carboxylate reductase [Secundilactobacillus paracollinoides]
MKIGFIGVGGMAQAIITGLLKKGTVAASDILVHSAHETYKTVAAKKGVTAITDNRALVQQSDYVVLAVTPNVAADVLHDIEPVLDAKKQVLISIVAGLELNRLEELAGYDLPILRTLPNLNVAILAGMTAVHGNAQLTGEKAQTAISLFDAIGSTTVLPEADFATFSALAGSSPAYVYLFIDALSRAGVKYGLTKAQATQIAAQAVTGSAQMVLASDENPFALIDQVSSPGGSTVAGLLSMEENGFMTAVVKGIDATISKNNEE